MTDKKSPSNGKAIEAMPFDAPSANQLGKQDAKQAAAASSPNPTILATRDGAPWWHSQFNLMLGVFALLALSAGLFVLLAPAPNSASVNTVVSAQGEASNTESKVATSESELAPWDESRRQQARTDSQNILSELLTTKKDLESKNVQSWAGEAYAQALLSAEEGDAFYKVKDFKNAVQTYQAALDEMNALSGRVPQVVDGLVLEGNQAIDQGKTELAREKFQTALTLDRNHIPSLRGLDRAAKLDQVLALLRAAAIDEQDFATSDEISNLSLAADKYQQALELDPRTEMAKTGADRVAERIQDKQYRDAMSQGFNALFANRYGSAKQGFASALKVKPDDATASAAYRQSLASDKRSSLSSLISNAKRLEQNEEWSSALSTYQAILQRDPNQVQAKLGTIRSKARKALDQEITAVLSDTLALGKTTSRGKAQKILDDAKAIKRRGARLNQQIAQIEASFKSVDSVIKVSLNSDGLSDISLVKAGAKKLRLGKFTSKDLALKPGRYVVSATRLGFKDVRKEIELRASAEAVQTFSIACDTPIGGNSVARSQ